MKSRLEDFQNSIDPNPPGWKEPRLNPPSALEADELEPGDDRLHVVWCGVVWCGVVWCGVVWCGVVWCGVVWCGVVWCGVVWFGLVWRGVMWCGCKKIKKYTKY